MLNVQQTLNTKIVETYLEYPQHHMSGLAMVRRNTAATFISQVTEIDDVKILHYCPNSQENKQDGNEQKYPAYSGYSLNGNCLFSD